MHETITNFGGQVPRQTEFGLPQTFAARATNVKLQSGEVRGIHALSAVHDFGDPAISSAYRIPNGVLDLWLGFVSEYGVVIRSPLVNDQHERYYWHEPGGPILFNTKQRIGDGNVGANAPYWLGMPGPTTAPTITPAGGGSGPNVTRAYVYTWIDIYGQESAPSPPSTATAKDDDNWVIGDFDVTLPDAASRVPLDKVRIYRTVTSVSGTADYYRAGEIPIATLTFGDDDVDALVAGIGVNLESTLWSPPEPDFDGIVGFPGGVILGWRGNTVFMSVPYRPHAWNTTYQVSVQYPIVGLAVTGNVVVVATEGHPAAILMNTPDDASLQAIEAAEPCLRRGSIVGAPEGVYYASQNGLMFFSSGGFNNVTAQIVSKEDWLRFSPDQMNACRYQTQYIGLTQPGQGYVLDSEDIRIGFTEIFGLSGANMIQNDVWSGEVFLVSAGQVFKWDDATTEQLTWRWATRRISTPKEINIGAVRLTMRRSDQNALPTKPDVDAWGARTAFVAGGTGAGEAMPATPPIWAAFTLNVYIYGSLVFTRYVRDSQTIRLPPEYKSDDWQFEIVGRKPLVKFEWAENAKELAET